MILDEGNKRKLSFHLNIHEKNISKSWNNIFCGKCMYVCIFDFSKVKGTISNIKLCAIIVKHSYVEMS